jgi:hypothetical protein
MKSNGKHKVNAQIAGPGLVLAALLVLVFSSSSAGRAQSPATSSAVPAAIPAKAAPASQAAQPAATGVRKPGGNHEGIQVHGHWMIEVRNPDGKLVKRIDFENSLDPGFNFPCVFGTSTGTCFNAGGASYLGGLLTGQSTLTANNMAVLLGNIAIGYQGVEIAFVPGDNAPCQPTITGGYFGGNVAIGACVVAASGATGFCPSQAGPGVSCNLTVSNLGASAANNNTTTSFALTGAIVATQAGSIGAVATVIAGPVGSYNSFLSFTSSTNFPGAPLTIASGQLINVSVTISFGSGG